MARAAVPVCAAEHTIADEESPPCTYVIAPRSEYTAKVSAKLAIDSDGEAAIRASVYGYKDITSKASVSITLQKYKNKKWTDVITFSESSNSHRVRLYKTYKVSKGYKYRVVATSTVVHSGKSEIQTVTSKSVEY